MQTANQPEENVKINRIAREDALEVTIVTPYLLLELSSVIIRVGTSHNCKQ